MPQIIINWSWEEAFDKFGFSYGDGLVMTYEVESFLVELGYVVATAQYGLHNHIIDEIKTAEGVVIFGDSLGHEPGYEDPREALPAELVAKLDQQFA